MSLFARSANEGFARSCISAFAAQLDPTLEELNDIKTAVSEAVTNCIVHAYREKLGKIYITAEILEGGVLKIRSGYRLRYRKRAARARTAVYHRRRRTRGAGLRGYAKLYG